MPAEHIRSKLFSEMGVTFSFVKDGSTTDFDCVFQPLRYKNKIYLSGIPTELGYNSMRKYLIMTPLQVPFESLDGVTNYLQFESCKYRIDHYEKVYFKNEPLYYWAIIHKEDSI
ncbi:MAG: hypothetical protein II356_02505 [Clostridia bacterium]|nr:hypothetical protein [Clostridia bacterium]MBQ1966827.1 hypothetical protein [Clostridia bacterium]MBQ1996789.1 hypothetical protein [Clostridia bacterium]MBQ5904338.1 hypothetical protein [Clostridia bacterium]